MPERKRTPAEELADAAKRLRDHRPIQIIGVVYDGDEIDEGKTLALVRALLQAREPIADLLEREDAWVDSLSPHDLRTYLKTVGLGRDLLAVARVVNGEATS